MYKEHKTKACKIGRVAHKLLPLIFACIFLFSACSGMVPPASDVVPTASSMAVPKTDASGAPVAMLMLEEVADSPYGQAAFEQLSRVAGEVGLGSGLYRTAASDNAAVASALELAVKGGAQFVVLFGEGLSDAARQGVLLYPDVSFVLQDFQMTHPLPSNVVQIEYSALQSGFLAGYAGVYQHVAEVGVFLQAEDDESTRYALGFLLGADAAAQAQNQPHGDLNAFPLILPQQPQNQNDANEARRSVVQPLEDSAQSKAEDFFEETGDFALLFASQQQWAQTAVQATQNTDRVALPMTNGTPLESDAATIQVQYNAQRLLSQLLNDWQQNRFPGGSTVQGTLAQGDINLYAVDDVAILNDSAYENLYSLFENPATSQQVSQCLSLENEEQLPALSSLELDVYTLHEDTPPPSTSNFEEA